jgi:hypothetical protein
MARNTIVQRIALTGGEEIKKTLDSLGKSATDGFKRAESAVNSLNGPVAQFRQRLDEVAAKSYAFGSAIRDVADNAKTLAKTFGDVAKAAAVVGGAVFAATKQTADAGTAQFEGAQSAGLSVEAYGRLSYAFKQSGVDAAQAQKLFIALNDAQAGTSTEAQKTRAAIQGLGVSFTKLGDGSTDTERLLSDLADKFQKMPDGAQKSAIAAEIFGKRIGSKLIPFLNEGRAGIARLTAEAQRMGVVFNKDTAAASDQFGDSLDKLLSSFAGLRNAFTTPFLKPFADGMDAAAEALASLIPEAKRVGTAIATALVTTVKFVAPAFKAAFGAIMTVLDTVAAAFNKVFGTEITGKTILVVGGFALLTGVVIKLAGALLTMFPAVSGIVKLLTGIPGVITAITAGFKLLSSTVVAAVRGVSLAITVLSGLNPITLIILAIVAAVALLIIYWPQVSKAAQDAWKTISEGAQAAWKWVTETWAGIGQFFADLFSGEWIGQAWDTVTTAAADAWESVKSFAIEKLTALKDWIMSTWVGSIVRAIGTVIDKAKEAWEWVKKAFSGSGEGKAEGGPVGFSRGGKVFGPGTSTSDSISARLSRGEFVQRAAAVRHYGVDFMNAVNSLRFPAPQGFSVGGLVEGIGSRLGSIMPEPIRFAEGGIAMAPAGGPSGRPVVLQLPGGESFALTGRDDVVERLTRRASTAGLTSMGRKPSWKDRA